MELVCSMFLPLFGHTSSIRRHIRRTTQKCVPGHVCHIPYYLQYKCDVLFRNTCRFEHNCSFIIELAPKIIPLLQELKLLRQ
jgi:hypothetical protein